MIFDATISQSPLLGASRSVTIAAAYLIKYNDMGAEEALAFMKRKRSCVNPNKGYRDQLKTFEEEIKAAKEEIARGKKKK